MSDRKTIIFFCEWSSHPGLKLSRYAEEESGKEQKMIVSMCQGRVSPELILEAFGKGAWGVMLASCPPDECEHDANYKARRRILLTQKVLEQFGIEKDRLQMEWISKGDAAAFDKAVLNFESHITELGPPL